ncbi:hypothetical protein NPX13_g6745 [Xylaria arbuscula]|uniref:Heterokaryon incompatibility domain-containing protein n=1 Tax=Xylaria arbuscula TaxID=114810 RepID=A0A9W8NBM7_9PEZI|nr:hypothetical protein NPX13_g6745 [Xylaria arbuscula]
MDYDDSQETLLQISRRYNQPIASLLLNIQKEGHSKRQKLSTGFLKHLQCFRFESPGSNLLLREWISAFDNSNYVALSYTWQPSNYEDQDSHGFDIQNRARDAEFESPVRDSVFERIASYMTFHGVELLWIDRHSIKQRSDRESKLEKKRALECMDWVYKQSDHPVALLGRPLASGRELELLKMILMDELEYGDFNEALELLYSITNDSWWQRAWTFQENYKGGRNMTLLIPNPEGYEAPEEVSVILKNIPGEVCVNSVVFSSRLTEFCGKVRSTLSPGGEINHMIDSILSSTGRYNLLLEESQTMSPTVIAAVEKRGVANVWDRLPIIGNCCSYPVRMDSEKLRDRGHSLSLSMLTMCLLNGEILNNALSNERVSLNLTISSYLKARTFKKISSPEEVKSLTFNKGCRFVHARLNESGVSTRGHLWKLGRTIHTGRFSSRRPWVQKQGHGLSPVQRQCLTQLCQELRESANSRTLAKCITMYLKGDANGKVDFQFGENYMQMMMIEVAEAIAAGKKLRLGRLRDSRESMAVFIWDGHRTGDFVFTSSRAKKDDHEDFISNDVDNHVSVEVNGEPGVDQDFENPPLLYVNRWALGICFFVGCERVMVTFPWPQELAETLV